MQKASRPPIPDRPKLRPVEHQWVEYQGQPYLYLRDRMALAEQAVLIPQPLAPVVALCDGTRDLGSLRAGLLLRTGLHVAVDQMEALLAQLDTALLLENGAYQQASEEALREYRDAHHRRPSHAGAVYPADRDDLCGTLQDYCDRVPVAQEPQPSEATLVGMVSPHIDYARGHETYARLWRRAAPGLDGVELAIIFGTDHYGGPGMLTPTRQSYATPLGVLPTDREVVDGLAEALGPERAFAEEVHHLREHSIELASVWLHYFLGGRACPVVPILCGSFHHFILGEGKPEEDEAIGASIRLLREAMKGRRTLVIAAGDLAHVGPAFGDRLPLDALARARLAAQDSESLSAICAGDAGAFFARSRAESDARKICGLPPIYLTLRLLGNAWGRSLGYAQSPADAASGSVVSIAGVLLYQPA